MAKSEERRKYIRLSAPIGLSYVVSGKDKIGRTVSKDISPVGVRLETGQKIDPGTTLKLTLELPKMPNPVHAQGKVVWVKRVSSVDASPYEIGVEFTRIEEDNKNTFLKYLCDVIYNRAKKDRHA